MTFELKPLSKEAVPAALDKAMRYRLLNEPMQAESICLDILEVEPHHHETLVTLLLSLTDQFDRRMATALKEAQEVLQRLQDPYHRAYYEGIIWERRAEALYGTHSPGCGHLAYDELRRAMSCYESAIGRRPKGNDEAILRWNTCVRVLARHPDIKPAPRETVQPLLE